jgi:hypothetical protein
VVSLTAAVVGRMVTEAWPMAVAASAAVEVILAARRAAAMKSIRRLEVSAGIVQPRLAIRRRGERMPVLFLSE